MFKYFRSLNPHAESFGGMGNLIVGALGIQIYAFTIGRTVIFNNALITDLFHHPDPRQSWNAIPTPVLNGRMKRKIQGVEAIMLEQGPKINHNKIIGSHGANILSVAFHRFIKKNLPSIIFPNGVGRYQKDLGVYQNLVCQVRTILSAIFYFHFFTNFL